MGGLNLLPARAQFRVEIAGIGATQLPISLLRFRGEDKAPQPISQIIRADLERSGRFRFVETSQMFDETGVPGYDATIWLGIMAPKGTPNAIVDRLNAEIIKAIAAPAMKEAWAKQGAVPMSMTPDQFGDYMKKDIAKWADVIKKADIKLQ